MSNIDSNTDSNTASFSSSTVNTDAAVDTDSTVDTVDTDLSPVRLRGLKSVWLSKEFSIMCFLASLIAVYASSMLVLNELKTYQSPRGGLGCDVNPLIGCSSSLTSWQAHMFFGVPNALLGAIVFSALGAFGVFSFFSRVPRVFVLLFNIGIWFSLLWVAFFFYYTIFDFRTVCPFCFVVWVMCFIMFTQGLAELHRLGFISSRFSSFLYSERWLLLIFIVGVLVICMGFALSDKLALVFS